MVRGMKPLSLLSWGYWGWGNATRFLLEAVDSVEATHGFAPPIFVDIRFSRAVRAKGFRGPAFEQLVGSDRYRWLRGLGNRAIGSDAGSAIVIADPRAAADLLDLTVAASREGRRVLFFCACEWPRSASGTICHRVEVGRLVLRVARHRRQPLTIEEWPGGPPGDLALEVPIKLLRELQRGRKSIPLRGTSLPDSPHGFPVGTLATVTSAAQHVRVVIGPARKDAGGWWLPALQVLGPPDHRAGREEDCVRHVRRTFGLDARSVLSAARLAVGRGPGLPSTTLDERCIYTIMDLNTLDRLALAGGEGSASEGRQWVAGEQWLRSATENGRRLAVIFADAKDCTRLHYWALLTSIQLTPRGTEYRFERLREIRRDAKPQDLVLDGTGRPIAPGFIRPYALCRTPGFLTV